MTSSGEDFGSFSMLELFHVEVETQGALLSEKLLALENNPDPAKDLEALMRAAHSIKGAARIVQLDAAGKIAHIMEDCFVAAQAGKLNITPSHVDVLLQGVDMLGQMGKLSEAEINNWETEHEAEINAVVAAITAVKTPGAAPPAAVPPKPQPSAAVPPAPAPAVAEVPPAPAPAVAEVPPAPAPAVAAVPPAQEAGDFSMLELFRVEVESQTVLLNEKLLALENNPDVAKELEALMRASHSIKGAARVVQLDSAVRLAHVMEDCFVAAQGGKLTITGEHIDVFLEAVDLLGQIGNVSETEIHQWLRDHHADIEAIISAISGILHGTPVALPPKSAAPAAVTPAQAPAVEPSPQPTAAAVTVAKPQTAPQEKSVATPAKQSASQNAERVVRVSADNLHRLMGLAGQILVEANWLQPFADSLLQLRKKQLEISSFLEKLQEELRVLRMEEQPQEVITRAQEKTKECHNFLNDTLNELDIFTRNFVFHSDLLYREVIAVHMRPFADGIQGFPRMIRDVSRKLGKQVKFEIMGKNTPVDRDILEKLEAPLNHILRNAIDHGLEIPEERVANGKSPEGTVRLEAAHRAGMLSVTVTDDGRGVDYDRMRQKIISKQLSTPEMLAQMTENELLEFLFLPGFSTAKAVTEISGRGVGLDVVQSMIQEVGGVIRTSSKTGHGMSFQLQLPLTLSVTRTLLVEIAGEPYAFPLTRIERMLLVNKSDISVAENRQYFYLEEQNIGLIAAHQILELKATPPDSDVLSTIILSERSNRYGLVVDKFLGERDFVIKPLDSRLGKVPDINAAAIMTDNTPVLIVDVDDMVRSMDRLLTSGEKLSVSTNGKASATTPDGKGKKKSKRILVVDDSITVRETERKLLENNGYEVEVSVDGMDGWNAVRSSQFDLVVSDIDMPRMNGFEFVNNMKNNPNLKSLPVIIVSYKDREEDRIRGMEVGADYYLTKSSFHDNTFMQAVKNLVGD